jgi:hypothetical protein
MKYFFSLLIFISSLPLLAQQKQPPQQIPHAQPNQPVPQAQVFRYDTVLTHDPQHFNLAELKIYSSTGRLVKTGKTLNDKKEGIWRTYYENGMLSRVGNIMKTCSMD